MAVALMAGCGGGSRPSVSDKTTSPPTPATRMVPLNMCTVFDADVVQSLATVFSDEGRPNVATPAPRTAGREQSCTWALHWATDAKATVTMTTRSGRCGGSPQPTSNTELDDPHPYGWSSDQACFVIGTDSLIVAWRPGRPAPTARAVITVGTWEDVRHLIPFLVPSYADGGPIAYTTVQAPTPTAPSSSTTSG